MKTVLLSTKPYWIFLIIAKTMGWKTDRQKTVEIRKSFPKNKYWDKTVILYCTKDKNSFNQIPKEYQPIMKRLLGKVIGEFVCDEIDVIPGNTGMYRVTPNDLKNKACLTPTELSRYGYDYITLQYQTIYGWHISDLKIYDEPKELSEFEMCNTYKGKWNKNGTRSKKIVRPPQSWCYVEKLG